MLFSAAFNSIDDPPMVDTATTLKQKHLNQSIIATTTMSSKGNVPSDIESLNQICVQTPYPLTVIIYMNW